VYAVLVTIYVIVCFFLILVVLLQQGKGADIAGAFGGGSSQTAFGARGATTFLHKVTTGAFIGFVVLSLLLAILEARPKSSVISKSLPAAAGKAPASAPAAQPGAPGQSAPGQPAAAPAAPSSGTSPQPAGSPAKP
jgi:preprotein translocase subunit SecG